MTTLDAEDHHVVGLSLGSFSLVPFLDSVYFDFSIFSFVYFPLPCHA